MATRKYVQYSITGSIDYEDPLEDWGDSEEEVKTIIEEDAKEILMEGWADWDVWVRFVEREEDE